jgi:hypothetical protein
VRGIRAERVVAPAVAREGERRAVRREDLAAIGGDLQPARIVAVGRKRRTVDEDDPQLPYGETRERDDEQRAEPRDRAIRQTASPPGTAARSRSSV